MNSNGWTSEMTCMLPQTELPPETIKPGVRCLEIDSGRLDASADHVSWLEAWIQQCAGIVTSLPSLKLYVASWVGPSTDFGGVTIATWIAFVGSGPLADVLFQVLEQSVPQDCVRASVTDSSQQGWHSEFCVRDGAVWRAWDAATWKRVEIVPVDESQVDGSAWGVTKQPAKKASRVRGAKSDASVGAIQAAIENTFKLPKGSVKLINPDKSISRRNQTIGKLRARWDE